MGIFNPIEQSELSNERNSVSRLLAEKADIEKQLQDCRSLIELRNTEVVQLRSQLPGKEITWDELLAMTDSSILKKNEVGM